MKNPVVKKQVKGYNVNKKRKSGDRIVYDRERVQMINCIVVGIGGFAGAVMRYLIGLIPINLENGFPVKTFCINVAGAFVIGLVAALGTRNSWNPRLILFLKVGLCGGFTTFSSFALETDQMIAKGQTVTAALYVILSLCAGMLAVSAAQNIFGRV